MLGHVAPTGRKPVDASRATSVVNYALQMRLAELHAGILLQKTIVAWASLVFKVVGRGWVAK